MSVFTPTLIRASAGTGKTYQLSSRYIDLLAAGEQPDRILATTFTRKAAGEIQDRVLHRLAEKPDTHALLVQLVRRLHRLNICTLDSFFNRIAGSFSLELGLPPGWRIVDEVTDQRLQAEAVGTMIEADGPQRVIDLMRLLNPGELRRSVHEQIMSVVSALHDRYREQPDEAAWCWMTPPEKLPIERVRAAVEAMGHIDMPLTKAGTPVKAWVKALADAARDATREDWESFLKGGIAGKILAGDDKYSSQPITGQVVAAFEPLIHQARAELLAFHASKTRAMFELLRRFDTEYERLKLATGALRFADVTHELARAADDMRCEDVYYRLDGRIGHLLLDEFQDTSYEQWRVVQPLADEVMAVGGTDRLLFCVGDVKQAIYGWRGGQAEIFDTLQQRWDGLDVQTMDTTRRCAPPIVDAINAVFGTLPLNPAAASFKPAAIAWDRRFNMHAALETEAPGYVRLEVAPEPADDQKSKHAVLKHAADRIAQIVKQCPGRSVGVLVRTNRAVARLIYELRAPGRDIDASEEGGSPVTDCAPVSVIMSLLHLADHPGDTAARFHVQTSPLGEIVGLTDLHDAQADRVALDVRRTLLEHGYGPTLNQWAAKLAPACSRRDLMRMNQLVELGHQYEADATVRPSHFVQYVAAQRVADMTRSDVRVMTVHQSKGLEFDIVVLPELDARLGLSGREQVVIERDAADPVKPPVRITRYPKDELRAMDPALAAMHQQTAATVIRESFCVLYVAMTRARHALHMIIPPAARLGASFAGIVHGALNPEAEASGGETLYEVGDAQWHEHVKASEPAAEPRATMTLSPKLAASQHSRMIPRRAPSQLEGGTAVDLNRMLQLQAGGGRGYGTSVHDRLAKIQWVDEATDDPALKHETIRAALRRDRYPADASLIVKREQRFAVRLDEGLLTGAIDRLVITCDGDRATAAEIIDYKTDRVDDAEALAEYYRPQIQAYRTAVSVMYGLPVEAITARLLLLNTGDVVQM